MKRCRRVPTKRQNPQPLNQPLGKGLSNSGAVMEPKRLTSSRTVACAGHDLLCPCSDPSENLGGQLTCGLSRRGRKLQADTHYLLFCPLACREKSGTREQSIGWLLSLSEGFNCLKNALLAQSGMVRQPVPSAFRIQDKQDRT